MNKKFTGLLVVALCGVQMPASATDYSSWSELKTAFNLGAIDFGIIPIGMKNAISASNGDGPLTNWSLGEQTFNLDYDLTGGGGNNAVFHNEQHCNLSIQGGQGSRTINSNGATMQTITNNGNLTIFNATLTNGILQTNSDAKLNLGLSGNYYGGYVTLSGNNNITAGQVGIVSPQAATVVFDGGTLGKGAYINITGLNQFVIQNGHVTLNDSALSNQAGNTNADLWEAQAYYSLTGGKLTFDKFIHDTTPDDGAFSQAGGTLHLTNASHLNLSTYSITTNGSGSGVSTVNIGATSGADTSSLTVTSGVQMKTAAAGDTLTINIGNGSTGNSLNIAGGILDSSATVVLNANNTLNISGGSATLNESGVGIDTLIGAVNLSGGDLYLDSVVSHGAFTQTGGNIHIENGLSRASAPVAGEHHFHGGTINLRNNGVLTLASPDTWTASNFAILGGSLILDGFTHDATTAGSGTINQTSGATQLLNGSILTVDDTSHFTGGSLVINNNGTLNLSTTTGQTLGASLSGDSTGVINKNGTGTLLLTGQNAGYYGALNVLAGDVDFNASSGNTDSYISGTTTLASGSSLNLNTNGSDVVGSLNNISGGTVNKTGTGEYTVLAGSNGAFDYALNVNQGSWNVVADTGTTADFNAPVTVDYSTLTVSAGSTNFNNGLTLSHGYLGILNNGFDVTGNLSVGSTVNTMNGVVATNNISGNLNVGSSETAEFMIDVSPSAGTSDDYKISGAITKSGAIGTINISDFSIVGAPVDTQSIDLKVFDATLGIDPGVSFTSTDKIVKSTASMYSLSASPLQNGDYTLDWEGYNPEAFRGQVATEAAYANQLTTHNVLFDHIGLVSQQLPSEEKTSVWYKGYGNIEKLHLSQGINTKNNLWGSLVGVDFPLVQLENGWAFLPTAYIGYTGGYQDYSGVNMRQNGGQGGIMGTFYNGNFTTSLLANVGGYGNNMSLEGTKDSTDNWLAGGASKSAYDVELSNDFVLQPNMLVSFNAIGSQNWDSSYGSTSMTTDTFNGLTLAPGLNLILNKKTWSVYATTQLMYNAIDGTDGTVGDVNLPTVEMGSTTFHCGLGGTKQIQDRLSLYGQIGFSDGAENGVGLQGGVQWNF